MRVAIVVSSLGRGGAEKQLVYMAGALHKAGVDVRVFYSGTGGFYEKELRGMGIDVVDAYCAGRTLRSLWVVLRALQAFRPHIVMAGQFGEILYAGIAGRLSGALTIAGVRSDGFYEMNRVWYKRWLMQRLPHFLVANSYNAQRNLISMGMNSERVKVLQNVIDLTAFDRQSEQAASIAVPPDRILVAAVGRLHPEHKRFDRLLDAAALLPVSNPPVTILMVGRDQGAKAALEEKAKRLGLPPDRLVFAGESQNVPAVLKRCHMLVLTSDYEGFPNSVLEAMAARLPVITTPAGDSPRLVKDGITGYVVEFENPGAMAGRIVELAKFPELRKRMGEAGRVIVENQYDIRLLPDRLFAVFCDLAELQRRAALRLILTQFLRAASLETSSLPVS